MNDDYSTILPQGAIFELIPQGAYVKVSAVDPVTRQEVSIVGDRGASPGALKQIALRKLARVVAKSKAGRNAARLNHSEPPSGWDL